MKRKFKRHKKPGKKKKIDLDMDQLDDLLKRAESGSLQEKDIELIKGMAAPDRGRSGNSTAFSA